MSTNDPQPPGTNPSEPQLPTKKKSRTGLITGIAIAAVVVIVAAVIVIVNIAAPKASSSAGAATAKPVTVSIGVTDAAQPYWRTFSALAKKKLNVTVKLVNFSDYSKPNPALSQGQTDLNEFQHIQFLANYNVTNHDDLQPIGSTAVYPLPLYSLKYKKVSELPANAKVAIPNDAINEARGLLVLKSAGLVDLKDGGTAFSTTSDVTSSKVQITTIDASQTAQALQTGSVDAAIINNNYATAAKIPTSDAIYKDDPASSSAAPYVNVFVARKADAGKPLYLKLAALYHDPTVEKQVQEANGGTAVFRDVSAKELQSSLKKVEADAKAAQNR